MLRRLPERWSVRWLYISLIYLVVIWAILVVNRYLYAVVAIDLALAMRLLLLSAILSAIANVSGWLGARWIWLCSTLGFAAGLLLFFINSTNHTGCGGSNRIHDIFDVLRDRIGAGIIIEAVVALFPKLAKTV